MSTMKYGSDTELTCFSASPAIEPRLGIQVLRMAFDSHHTTMLYGIVFHDDYGDASHQRRTIL